MVNGERLALEPDTTVRDLLARLGVGLDAVAVERNRVLLARREHETTRLAPGDVLEVVTFVGGG
jgi:sulfur carrier protein